MTPTPVELRIAAALADHAEETMSQTDTESELQDVLGRGTDLSVRRRRAGAVGGLVAAALVVCGAVLWPTGHEPDSATIPVTPTRSIRPMNADEQLAHDFVSTYFAFDRKGAASFVADDAKPSLRSPLGPKGWLRQNRLEEALDYEFHLDGCFQIATVNPEGARIGCLHTANLLGLGDLGRGPFSGNLFNITVRDGKVIDFQTAVGANDYDELGWGPFWSWIEDTHASEVPALEEMDEPDLTPKEVTRMIRAWRQIGQEYAAALRSGAVG